MPKQPIVGTILIVGKLTIDDTKLRLIYMQKLSFRSGSGSDNNFTPVYDASESQEAANSSMNTEHSID